MVTLTSFAPDNSAPSVLQCAPYSDVIIPQMLHWQKRGQNCALVTLVGVDGAAPRGIGAQMAVSQTGNWAGYISGGCLEEAIALEAIKAIETKQHKLIRYGKGSPYFDIRLPCGSGLDVFIQPAVQNAVLERMQHHLSQRESFVLEVDLDTGESTVKTQIPKSFSQQSERYGQLFRRVYAPAVKCIVIGESPIANALSSLAAISGFDVEFYTSARTSSALPPSVVMSPLTTPYRFKTDERSAAIVAFHDHDREMPVFAELLQSPCFFVSAIGSRAADEARRRSLTAAGYSEQQIASIKSPAGLIGGLKSAPQIALSILAEVLSVAREKNLLQS